MNCPYCNQEMTFGYVQGGRTIFFSARKHRIFGYAKEDEVNLGSSLNLAHVDAYCCPACKKVIIDYTETEQNVGY